MSGQNKAIFWDLDGTLIPDIPHNVNPDIITFNPGAGEAIKHLHDLGFLNIIVANKGGIALEKFAEEDLTAVWDKIQVLLEPYEVTIDEFYYCPHHPKGTVPEYTKVCDCRKPAPGMLLKAAEEYEIDLSQSWMIGDAPWDMIAGKIAGCQTIKIGDSEEDAFEDDKRSQPDYQVDTIQEAEKIIVTHHGKKDH